MVLYTGRGTLRCLRLAASASLRSLRVPTSSVDRVPPSRQMNTAPRRIPGWRGLFVLERSLRVRVLALIFSLLEMQSNLERADWSSLTMMQLLDWQSSIREEWMLSSPPTISQLEETTSQLSSTMDPQDWERLTVLATTLRTPTSLMETTVGSGMDTRERTQSSLTSLGGTPSPRWPSNDSAIGTLYGSISKGVKSLVMYLLIPCVTTLQFYLIMLDTTGAYLFQLPPIRLVE